MFSTFWSKMIEMNNFPRSHKNILNMIKICENPDIRSINYSKIVDRTNHARTGSIKETYTDMFSHRHSAYQPAQRKKHFRVAKEHYRSLL